jgi:hypothetical protein
MSEIKKTPQNRSVTHTPTGRTLSSGPKATPANTPADVSGVRTQSTANLANASANTPSNRRAGAQLNQAQKTAAAAVTGPVNNGPDKPVPQDVVDKVGSKDKDTRAKGFTYLSERAAKGDQTALTFIRKTRGSDDYTTRDEATGALLNGESFLTGKDYKDLVKTTIFDSDIKKKTEQVLSRAVSQQREGAADALRDSIKNDSVYGGYKMDTLVNGLGDRIGKDDYKLLLGRLKDLDDYSHTKATRASLVKAIQEKKGGVAEEIDRQLSVPVEGRYGEDGQIKNGLRMQAKGNKDYQPPQALFENLDKLHEKAPDKARDLLEHAFAASSKPEKLGAYAHHLIDGGFLQEGDSDKKVMTAAKARLKAGGTEPLLAARKVLSSEDANRRAEGRAIQVYQMAPEMLEMKDVAVLAKLQDTRGEQLGVDASDVARTLGMAGQHAKGETLEAIRAQLRKGMEHKDPRVRDDFAEAMKGMSSNLAGEDLIALTGKLNLGSSTKALVDGVTHADKDTRRAVLDKVRGELRDGRGWAQSNAAKVMESMAADLSPQDVASLTESVKQGRHSSFNKADDAALKAALTGAKDPKTKVAAAAAMMDVYGRRGMDDDTLRDLSKVVADSGDPKLKKALLAQLKKPPLNEENLKALGETYQKKLSQRIKDAHRRVGEDKALYKGDKSLDELGKLMGALHMKNDSDSEYSSYIDKNKVNKRLQEVLGRSDVKREFEEERQDAIREAMPHLVEGDGRGYNRRVKEPGKAQQDYLLSADYEAKMRLLSPEERQKDVGGELGRLAQMDPEKAKAVAKTLDTRAKVESVKDDPLAYLQSLPEDQQENALKSVMDAAGMGKKAPTLAKHLSTALRKVDVTSLKGADDASMIIKMLKSLKGKPGISESAISKAVSGIEGMDSKGRFGSAMGTFAVGSLLMRGVPQNWNEGMRSGADLLEITSHSGDYAKVLGVSDDLLKVGKLAKFTKAAKVLGPVSDMVTVPLDAYGSYQDFDSGDYVGGWSKAVGAGAGAVSLAAGIAALSPAAGPGAPIVLVGALVVGVGATIVDWIWGRDPTEQMLQNLGVAKD